MRRALTVPSLRRALAVGALALAIAAGAGMVLSFSLAVAQRNEIERETDAFISEQRIADNIAALTYQQQLAAYRYLQAPDSAFQEDFRRRGDEAYVQLRRYLFHSLSTESRLQVERIKEAHQRFEVAAQRTFDLAQRGETQAARARLTVLDQRAEDLDVAVSNFLAARLRQREASQRAYQEQTAAVRFGLAALGALLVLLSLLLSDFIRRRVLRPLDQLMQASARIGSGDALARVPPQQYAEFAAVAGAFNEMADRVQASRETTEMQNEELRETLDHLQQTQSELVQHEKLSAMGQMLAGLAHELNNPLAAILGMAELLRAELRGHPDARMQRAEAELAEPLEREAHRARGLVRSLLNFARKPSGTLEPVSLAAAVSTAVGLRSHAYALAGKTLSVNVPQRLYVLADVQKLQHAIVNVVNNSLDAMVSDGGTGLVITASGATDLTVRLDFEDDGPGFRDPAGALTPFYTTKSAEQGTGLGLTLVQKFLAEFGGSMTVGNRPSGGARVSFLLRRGAPADVTPEVAPVAAGVPERTAAPRGAVSRRVLVVDDEPSLREVQRRLLTREGYEVLLASSGEEAREIIGREPLDLVISDLRMPGATDGRGLLAWLQREHPSLAAHALLVTGDVSGAASMELPVPPERVIHKPFAREEYLARIREALDHVQVERSPSEGSR